MDISHPAVAYKMEYRLSTLPFYLAGVECPVSKNGGVFIVKKLSTKALAQIALLMAIEIILNRFFSFHAPVVRTVNLAFLPIAIIAMLHGPLLAGVAAALTDVLGFYLFPAGPWPFFPGFTLSAFLTGVIYGIFLYNSSKSLLRIVLSVVAVTLVVRMGLNVLWLSMMWEDAFLALLPPRIVAALAMALIQVVLIRLVASERFYSILGPKPAAG